MNSSATFLPSVGIRAGATVDGMVEWPNDNDVWDFAGPCRICESWGIYGDAGDYCLDCN